MESTGSLIFRKPTLDDVEDLFVLKNDEEAAFLLGGIYKSYSKEDIMKWIEYHTNQENEVVFVVYDVASNKLIGHIGLYKINNRIRKAEYGILIADRNSRGKGYGTMCTKFMIEYGFERLTLNKITAVVLSENRLSISMFKKCGFVVEGVLKDENFKNNRYYDEVFMSIFKQQ